MSTDKVKIQASALLHRCLLSLVITIMSLQGTTMAAQDVKDSDKLGMAIDYFQAGKYHEALLLFTRLGEKYNLNPRFQAYMGVCYYHEGDYKEAIEVIDKCLDKLGKLSPQELSVYVFSSAESHFFLDEYDKAIPMYERMLLLCHDNEKADAYFRLGFCYMQREEWALAHEHLSSAAAYYERYGCAKDKQSRLEQIKNMIAGCKEKM